MILVTKFARGYKMQLIKDFRRGNYELYDNMSFKLIKREENLTNVAVCN
jgi:hypothetical protein